MMKMKQVVGLLLAAAMTTGLLAACGNKEATESVVKESESIKASSEQKESEAASTEVVETEEATGRISEETITITLGGVSDFADNVWNNTFQFAEYEERLGLKFDATTYSSEEWKTKFSLMLASDELPDMIANVSLNAQQVAEYGKDGYFLDISQYMDIMPNFCAALEEYPEYYAAIADEDGAIYALAKLNTNPPMANMGDPCYFRKDWCENLGLEVPTSIDELYEVLVAFKEQDADGDGDASNEVPFLFRSNDLIEDVMMRSFGIYTNDGNYCTVVEDGKVVLMNITENFKEYVRFMNKLYKEGLMNEDAAVMTSEQKTYVHQNDLAGIYSTWSSASGGTLSKEEQVAMHTMVGSFTSEYNPEPVVVVGNTVSSDFKWAVSATTEYPEEICKFIDYLFTEEGFLSQRFGYADAQFETKEIAGVMVADYGKYAENWTGSTSYDFTVRAVNAFTICNMAVGGSTDVLVNVSDDDLYNNTEVIECGGINTLKERLIRSGVKLVPTSFPNLKYTEAELKERSILYTDVVNYLKTAKDEFIFGAKDIDKEWDNYIATLKQMGLDRLLEIEQDAYDRYAVNLK